MFDGGILMPNPYDGITMIGVKSVFDHMVLKDCYEAGLISEDVWKSYLKRLIEINTTTKEEDNDGNTQRLL